MLDQRVPFRSYDKRIGSARDAVKLREFWESVLFVNVNASAHVLKRWPHCRRRGCHRLQPSLTLAWTLRSPTSTKAYICIFRCPSSGMTQLEFTSDLSTDVFFRALIRMISRRGLCGTIWSDNAKTFKSADREIQQLFTQESSACRSKWIKKSSRLN